MLTKQTCRNITWIDLESPTPSETRSLMEEYGLHFLVAEELLTPTLRPKVDIYENCIYLILHFPTVTHSHDKHSEQEIDFIIGKNFFITAHYGFIDSLDREKRLFDVNAILKKCNIGDHAGFLFFSMIKELYATSIAELDVIHKNLDDIENRIFKGEERLMVGVLSKMNRKLLNFKKAISQHKEVLESLEIAGRKFFGPDFSYYLRAITGEYYKVAALLEGTKEISDELQETNNSLLTTKTNDIMKTLTIMGVITFPSMLLASLFSMNTDFWPIVGVQNDFWVIVGIMAAVTIGFFAFFKYKKWF